MDQIKEGYTRVSEILSMIPTWNRKEKKWHYPFQSINQEVLENKCRIGTNVHKAIESHLTKDFYALESDEKSYFTSFLQWHELVKLKPVLCETRFYNESLKISGAIDLIAYLGDDPTPTLIDFKTSACADLIKWEYQANFYHLLASAESALTTNVLFVQLQKDEKSFIIHTFKITKNSLQKTFFLLELFRQLT